MKTKHINLKIIGLIHSPYKTTDEAPFQKGDAITTIELQPEFEEALTDIEGFTHLHIFYWLHQSHHFHTLVQTPWDTQKHGLFTTRSPHRPNPLGYATVQLIKREKNILHVKGLDAIDGTPVIDIKPYIPSLDAQPKATCGWIEQTKLNRH